MSKYEQDFHRQPIVGLILKIVLIVLILLEIKQDKSAYGQKTKTVENDNVVFGLRRETLQH